MIKNKVKLGSKKRMIASLLEGYGFPFTNVSKSKAIRSGN
jgi:hypothetical protein